MALNSYLLSSLSGDGSFKNLRNRKNENLLRLLLVHRRRRMLFHVPALHLTRQLLILAFLNLNFFHKPSMIPCRRHNWINHTNQIVHNNPLIMQTLCRQPWMFLFNPHLIQ